MKALKKTISYRITVLIGSALIYLGSFFIVNNTVGAVTSGFVVSEIYRSGIYYAHEKFWEKQQKSKTKKPPEQLNEYHKKYGVDYE